MITKNVRHTIDRAIKRIWLKEICEDYGRGNLLREASLQSSLYHHLRVHLEDVLKENHLFIYPEFYIPELKYRADMAIVQMELLAEGPLSQRVSDIAAVVELKYEGGTAHGTLDVIKADLQKMRQYARQIGGDCQFYSREQ